MTHDQKSKIPTRKVLFATVGSMAFAVVGGYLARFLGDPWNMTVVISGWPVIGAFLGGYVMREWTDAKS